MKHLSIIFICIILFAGCQSDKVINVIEDNDAYLPNINVSFTDSGVLVPDSIFVSSNENAEFNIVIKYNDEEDFQDIELGFSLEEVWLWGEECWSMGYGYEYSTSNVLSEDNKEFIIDFNIHFGDFTKSAWDLNIWDINNTDYDLKRYKRLVFINKEQE